MKRRDFMKTAALGLSAWSLSSCRSGNTMNKKPNIILIMVDDFGYECLGCNGSLDYKTPHVDLLAATGLRFDHCHSQPLCTPSRAQIMTGRYNQRNYIGFGELEKSEITFGHMLKDAGYVTGIAGKWQLGRDRKLIEHFGFDEYCLWWLENKSPRYVNVGELIRNGEVLPGKKGEYGPDVVSDFILDFISLHKDEPFFCYYPMMLTHAPFQPTPDSDDQRSKDIKRNFTDMVNYMDKIVGKIVSHLDKLDLLQNTLIIFTGDNGSPREIKTNTSQGTIHGGKGSMTDAGTHVPLVVNWKGVTPEGSVIHDLIDFSDFAPTIIEAAGGKLPGDRVIDGRSFLPQVKGHKGDPREWIFCHYWGGGRTREGTKEFIRDGRWKLFDDGSFYDLQSDPLQQRPFSRLEAEAAESIPAGEALAAKIRLESAMKSVHARSEGRS